MLVGLVLLTAGGLKAYHVATGPMAGDRLLALRWVVVVLFELELFLGLWLLSGVVPRYGRVAALACFSAFLGISAFQALAGETSCGCFGPVAINPWLTTALDVAVIAALLSWRPTAGRLTAFAGTSGRGALFACLGSLIMLSTALTALRYQPGALTDDGQVVGDADKVVLTPSQWVGRGFPLVRHIDIGAQLEMGEWIVVLYRRECRRCHKVLGEYERLAQESSLAGRGMRVALVEVNAGNNSPEAYRPISACLRGRLSSKREWVTSVPVVLHLQSGRVTNIVTDIPEG